MLLTGVLPDDELARFRPAKLTLDTMSKLLDRKTFDRRNRKVSIPRVLRLARDMTNDRWRFTGDPIKVDKTGFVMDGQHRLLAIFTSNTRQNVAVLYGVDDDVQLVVDTGRPRTANDQLNIRGAKHARHVAAASSLLLRWRAGQIMNAQYQPTITEITELAEGTPELSEGATCALRILTHIKHAPITSLMAAYVESLSLVTPEEHDYFFKRLERGDELPVHHPILTLRNTFSRYTPDRPVPFRMVGRLWQITHAWNKWRGDEKIQMLRVPSTLSSDSFPKMR
jgi:hypothetical protein